MSGAQQSGFANVLFNPLMAGQQQAQQNQLQMQQLDLTAADHEQVGRLAAGLLNIKDPAARAQAYAQGVGVLQSQGLAKYAPPTLPDEQSLQMLVSQTIPVQDQYKMGIISPPGLTDALARASAPPPGYGGTGATATPATTPPGSGATIGQRQNNPGNLTFAGQPGAQPGQGNRFASFPDMPTGVAATADQLALYQTQHNINTVRGAVTRWVSDPKADLTSYIGDISKALGVGPDDKIDLTDPGVQAKFIQAQFPHESAGGGYVLDPADVAKGVQMAAANRGRAVQAPGTAIATAAQPGATPPPTQYAGPGAPGAPTLPPAATETPPGPAQPAAPTAAPAQPGQPQPAAAPAVTAQPGATPLPGTGVNSQQFQTALWKTQQAALLETQFPNSPAAKAKAAELRAEAALYMQADSVITLPNGIQVKALSGQQIDAAKPLPHYVYNAAQHAYIDTTGTNKPEFEPAQRDSAVAQRDVMELGPKVANGTATQAEQAQYATAVETYRQPVLRENPLTKETVRVNTRELPTGFPEPPGLNGSGALGGAATPRSSQTVMPGMSLAQQNVEPELGKAYATSDKKSYDTANASLGMLVNANNAAEVLNRNPGGFTATGAGANTRLELGKTLNTVSGLFGGGPVVDPSQISAWEALNKQTRLMGMQVVNSYFGGSREAASIINGATSAVPNSENSYLGFRLVSSGIEQDLLRQRELYEFKGQQLAAGKPLATAEAEFNKANPVENYTARAIANAVPDDIAAHLVAHPDTVKAFDQHFGPGIGEFILKGGRSGMGRAGVPSNG